MQSKHWLRALMLIALTVVVGCGTSGRNRRGDDDERSERRRYGGPRNARELDDSMKTADGKARDVAAKVSPRNDGRRSPGRTRNLGAMIELWPHEGKNGYDGESVDADNDGEPDISPEGWDVLESEYDLVAVSIYASDRHLVPDEMEIYMSEESGEDLVTVGGDDRRVIEFDDRDLPEALRSVDGGNRRYLFRVPKWVSEQMRNFDNPLEMRKVRFQFKDRDGNYLHLTRHSGDPTRSNLVFWSPDPNVRFTCRNADDDGGASIGVVILDEENDQPRERELPGPPRRGRVSE